MKNNNDFGKALDALIKEAWPKYRGCLLEKDETGYRWSGKWYTTWEDACVAVDKAYENLQDSSDHLSVTRDS